MDTVECKGQFDLTISSIKGLDVINWNRQQYPQKYFEDAWISINALRVMSLMRHATSMTRLPASPAAYFKI